MMEIALAALTLKFLLGRNALNQKCGEKFFCRVVQPGVGQRERTGEGT